MTAFLVERELVDFVEIAATSLMEGVLGHVS
jgi:hypothetical protein